MVSNKQPQVKYKNLDLIAIPAYVYNALQARGITLAKLDEVISKDEIGMTELVKAGNLDTYVQPSALVTLLKENLSSLDVKDIAAATRLFHNLINYNPSSLRCVSSKLTSNSELLLTNETEKALIHNLKDLTIDMRITNNEVLSNTFKVEVINNHVYVLIRKGFFNFKFYNIPDFRLLVLKGLMFNLFKFFSPEQIQSSDLFQDMFTVLRIMKK